MDEPDHLVRMPHEVRGELRRDDQVGDRLGAGAELEQTPDASSCAAGSRRPRHPRQADDLGLVTARPELGRERVGEDLGARRARTASADGRPGSSSAHGYGSRAPRRRASSSIAAAPATIVRMLGGVLTAIATPFDERRRDRLRRVPAARGATSSTTAPTGSSSPGRRARRRRSTTPSGSTSSAPALEAVGDRATVVAGTGTNDTAHSVDMTAQRHEAGARRVPRRHAVLQQAAAARHRRALRGGRARHRPADRRLQHPEPRRRQHRARDDLAARRDRERDGREAGERRPRRRRGTSSTPGSTSTRATTTSSSRSSSSAASAGSASTRTSSGRRSPSRCARCARATSSAPARSTRELAPAYELLGSSRTRSRSRPR